MLRVSKNRLDKRSRNLRRNQRDALARIGLSTAGAPMAGALEVGIDLGVAGVGSLFLLRGGHQ